MLNENELKELIRPLEIFRQTKVTLLFRGDNAISTIANIPPRWQQLLTSDMPVSQAISQIWAPVADYTPTLITHLIDSIQEVALLLSSTNFKLIGLWYIQNKVWNNQVFWSSWLGELPATEATIANLEKRLSIQLPSSYRLFSTIHNGFTENGNYGKGFLPLDRLSRLSKFNKEEVVEFYSDGGGNIHGYHLAMPDNIGDWMTIDWDHEMDELSHPQTFWQFLESIPL